MSQTLRTFVAIEMPGAVIRALAAVQRAMAPLGRNVRWVRPENIHLTLKFLGDVPAERIDDVAIAVDGAAGRCPELGLRVQGLGVFPGLKRPRVLWAGIHGDTVGLEKLHRQIDQALERCGFAPETRPFQAHLTLGRFKDRIDGSDLARSLEREGGYDPVAFPVEKVTLFKSRLTPRGAIYTRLASAGLRG